MLQRAGTIYPLHTQITPIQLLIANYLKTKTEKKMKIIKESMRGALGASIICNSYNLGAFLV